MSLGKFTVNLLIVVSAVAASSVGICAEPEQRIAVTTSSLNTTHQLIGPLGRPVGEVFTVDMVVTEKRDKGLFEDYVTVTSIEGKALQPPVSMPARLWRWSGIEKLSKGTHYHVRVYQDAGMIGHPDAALKETTGIQTMGHTFACWLVILKPVPVTK